MDVSAGADINEDGWSRTPLMIASGLNYAEIVDELVKAGASLEAREGEA